MTRFLFVHGGCHGAWCWELLIHILENLGHKGFSLDLPGHGSDRTPRQDVTFNSYVEKLSQFIEEKGLSKLVLVGHSLAGIILPEIASIGLVGSDQVKLLICLHYRRKFPCFWG